MRFKGDRGIVPLRRHSPRGIYVWLAVLTFCAVFAATAGAREAVATRTQALHQTLDAAPSLAKTITANGTWTNVDQALAAAASPGTLSPALVSAESLLTDVSGQLYSDFNRGVVSLGPASAAWESMTSGLNPVQTQLPATSGVPVKFEVSYRQPLSQYARLVAGHLPAPPPPLTIPAGLSGSPGRVKVVSPGSLPYYKLIQVAVTEQTAARFHLRVGSKVQISGSEVSLTGGLSTITLQVSGIVEPRDPSSSFWTADPAVAVPNLQCPMCYSAYWVGGVITGPGEANAMIRDFGPGLTLQWTLPLAVNSVGGEQVQALSNALTSLSTQTPRLSGDLEPAAGTLTVAANLQTALGAFLATAQSVDALLWLLYVSLTAAGLAVLLLAARMVALRRSAELTVLRARGSSLWQLAMSTGGGAALACLPAAVIAVVLAILVVPGAGSVQGAGSAGGWWPPVAVLLVAVSSPAVIVAWQHRLPRRRPLGPRQPRGRVRLVVEVTLGAAAVAGIVVFRQQGTQAGAGVNLYTSAAPVLVAVPAVIVVLRLYPLVLRGLLRASARSSGAPAFLGLARAARTALTPALPAFALVLALTVAAFAGMVRDAVSNGEVAASWQTTGADVMIAPSATAQNFTIPATAAAAIAAVPGVTHAAQVWQAPWVALDGTQVIALAVDPASYAALVAATRGFPQISAGLLAPATAPGTAQPVLASPGAAALLGHGAVALSTQAPVRPVTVRVAGVVSATPGYPAGGAFIIMPLSVITSTATPPQPTPVTELLLTGSGIDRARLTTVVRDMLPGASATFRSDVLAQLTGAPLPHGAFLLFELSLAVAAGLGLAVMLFELALGAAEREATLARLATMGLGEGQRARVLALEVLPAVIAAGVAAWASAVVLPRVVAPAIDLSVFTGSSANVPLVPDAASVAIPLIGLAVLAAVSLGIEIWSRRRGVAAALRIGG